MTHQLVFTIILAIGTFQGIFLAINLWFHKEKSKISTKLLFGLVLIITLLLFQNFLSVSGYYEYMPSLIIPFYPFIGLIGPLFYFYIVYLLYPNRRFGFFDLLNSFLFVYLLYDHMPFMLSDAENKMQAVRYFYFENNSLPVQNLYFFITVRLFVFIYPVAAILFLRKNLRQFKESLSNSSLENLAWLINLSWILALAMVANIIFGIASVSFDLPIAYLEISIHTTNSLLIHYIAFVAIQHPQRLFCSFDLIQSVNNTVETPISKQQILTFMESEKPFLDPNLKIQGLAEKLNVSPHTLSKQINAQLNVNFYDFVNAYRVDEFKSKISTGQLQNMTIMALAYDAGFNSKSSFNRIFKKRTGMTPSSYLQSNLEKTGANL